VTESMPAPARSSCREYVRWFVLLALGILVMAGWLAALPGLAWSAPFTTGDVFLTGTTSTASVSEYSPAGSLAQTLPGTAGASVLCFDPTTGDLILPGVGLFDSSGNELASSWGSVTYADRCVADGLGDVYVSTCREGCGPLSGAISKYDLGGNLVQTYSALISTALEGTPPFYVALGPDRCTLYYGTYASDGASINLCTGTQSGALGGGDDLRALPDGDILVIDDKSAGLYDASGNGVRVYMPCFCLNTNSMSLDPDGTSFTATFGNPAGNIMSIIRYDIATGQILAQWTAGFGVIAVDPGPPPTSTALPRITGTDAPRYTLTASTGSWSANPTLYTYQWQDCDSLGNGCTNIGGATSSYYTLHQR
jgi:hypothetical protein